MSKMTFYNDAGALIFSIPDSNVLSCTVNQPVNSPFYEVYFTLTDDESCRTLGFFNYLQDMAVRDENYVKFNIMLEGGKLLSDCYLMNFSSYVCNGYSRETEVRISSRRFEILDSDEYKVISQGEATLWEKIKDQKIEEVSKLDKAINAITDFMKSSESEG